MRKRSLFLLCALLMSGAIAMAQSPQGFTYQAVVRNSANDLVINQQVGMRVSIRQTTAGGAVVYQETHTPTTNQNGLVTLNVGSGTVVSGTFATIDWGAGPYFIQSETDPAGGTAYTISGTTQLMSVPYALYAETSNNPGVPGPTGPAGANGAPGAAGPAGVAGPAGPTGLLQAGTSAGQTAYWDGTDWVIAANLYNNGGGISMGTNAAPDGSAQLEVSSTTKGFLMPRMTTAQRTAIGSPANGLLVFDTDLSAFFYRSGAAWVQLAAPPSSSGGSDPTLIYTTTGF